MGLGAFGWSGSKPSARQTTTGKKSPGRVVSAPAATSPTKTSDTVGSPTKRDKTMSAPVLARPPPLTRAGPDDTVWDSMRKRGLVLRGQNGGKEAADDLRSSTVTPPPRDSLIPSTPIAPSKAKPVRMSFASVDLVSPLATPMRMVSPLSSAASTPSRTAKLPPLQPMGGIRRGSRNSHRRRPSQASIRSIAASHRTMGSITNSEALWSELAAELHTTFGTGERSGSDLSSIDVEASLGRAAAGRLTAQSSFSFDFEDLCQIDVQGSLQRRNFTVHRSAPVADAASPQLLRRLTRAGSMMKQARRALRNDADRTSVYEEAALHRLQRSESSTTETDVSVDDQSRDWARSSVDSYVPALDLALEDDEGEESGTPDEILSPIEGGQAIWPPPRSPFVPSTPIFETLSSFSLEIPVLSPPPATIGEALTNDLAVPMSALPYLCATPRRPSPLPLNTTPLPLHGSLGPMTPGLSPTAGGDDSFEFGNDTLRTPVLPRSRIPSPTFRTAKISTSILASSPAPSPTRSGATVTRKPRSGLTRLPRMTQTRPSATRMQV